MSDEDESLAPDEVYCTSCGEPIKKEAEICPECGVKNKAGGSKAIDVESSNLIGDEEGKVISWIAGIFFLLGGFGMLFDSVVAGIITTIMGLFLIPSTRTIFEEKIDYEFSRGLIVILVLIGMISAGAFMPSDTGVKSDNSTPTPSNNSDSDEREKLDLGKESNDEGGSVQANQQIRTQVKNSGGWASWIRSVDSVGIQQNLTQKYELSESSINSSDRLVLVNITIDPTGFADDYLAMADASSEVFKSTFETHPSVVVVGTNVYKRSKDKYGNYEKEYLGYAQMDSATNAQINWQGFETENLKDVAMVNFVGESSYLDLKESQEKLENLEERMDSYEYGSYGY